MAPAAWTFLVNEVASSTFLFGHRSIIAKLKSTPQHSWPRSRNLEQKAIADRHR